MKFFVLTIVFCAGLIFSSQAYAQTEHSVAEAQPLVEVEAAKVNEAVISTSHTDDCCCRPVRNAVKRVVCVPVKVFQRVKEVRPVSRMFCRVRSMGCRR